MNANDLLTGNQFGLYQEDLQPYNCYMYSKWTELIDQGSNIGVAYMYFMKAFDKVLHGHLIKK